MKQGIFTVICSNTNSFSPGPISENELHSVKGGTLQHGQLIEHISIIIV